MTEITPLEQSLKFRGVALRLEYFDYFKDITVAIFLSQLHYWYMPDRNGKSKLRVQKNGKWYLVKSYLEWYNETRLSQKQVTRALTILRDSGVLEVTVMRFNGLTTNHITAINVVGNIPLQDGSFLLPESTSGSFHFLPQGDSGIYLKSTPITESTAETTTESILVTEKPSLLNPPQNTENGDSMKGPTTTNQLLKMVKEEKAGTPPVALKSADLKRLWKKTVEGYTANFTKKEEGQFNHLFTRLLDSANVMVYVLENWVEFTNHVEITAGLKNSPLKPRIDFLLLHCTEAYNWYTVKHTVQLIAKIEKVEAVAEHKPSHTPATLDELLALG